MHGGLCLWSGDLIETMFGEMIRPQGRTLVEQAGGKLASRCWERLPATSIPAQAEPNRERTLS